MSTGNTYPEHWSTSFLERLLAEPLRNGHSARESKDGTGIRTLTLTAVTLNDFSERNTKLTVADPAKVGDLWLRDGDILIERANTPELVGTANLYRGPEDYAIFPDLLIRVRLAPHVDARLVTLFLQSTRARSYFQRAAQGIAGSMPKISQGTVEELEVPVPPPQEQHRIVNAIDSYFTRLDDAVASLEGVQRNLKRYRASVLKAAVEGRLVPTEAELARAEGRDYEPASVLLERILVERRRRWEEAELAKMTAKGKAPTNDKWKAKYKEPDEPDTSGMPPLPEGWCWATAEALSEQSRSITYGVVKLGAVTAGGVPTLRSSNVRHLRLELDYVKPISEEISAAYKRTVLRGNEILVTVRGTLGGVIAIPSSCVGFNISREVAMIALVEPRLAPLVATFIGSTVLQNWMMRRTRGIAYTGVNIATLKQLPVPVPPLAEQARIVETAEHHLSIAASSETACVANERRCRSLRQSILKWAFEGRLVDQDPSDEPALALLARIACGREGASSTSKTKTRGRKKTRSTT